MGKRGVCAEHKRFIDQTVLRVAENIDAAFGPDMEGVDGVHQ
jgi:hypothetical protein